MNVKIVSVKDKGDHKTQGHGATDKVGFVEFTEDGRLHIFTADNHLFRTSRVKKITVETKNSIYELEPEEADEH